MLLLQRAREAAAEAAATRVLWQLRSQGDPAPWREKLTTAYGDIAETFEAGMEGEEGLGRELWASRAAFLRWFAADWRLDIYDDLMLKTLARIAVDEIGLIPTTRRLSDSFLVEVGRYAGQGFLVEGDGDRLIQRFRRMGLRAESRTRLNAILASAQSDPTNHLSPVVGDALSAVSPASEAAVALGR
jgi:hypothetical protein